MVLRSRITACILFIAGSGLSSCGGKVAEPVRPTDLTAKDALGGAAPVCTGEPKLAKPLVVDLEADARVDLEAAMKKGVVVVAYDCNTLRVLSACKLPDGGYDYVSVSRKEVVVQLKGSDEVKVNLPMSAGKLGGEVQAGRSIDLGLVYVGKRSTVLGKVRRDELQGTCEGATHFLQSATLGAFAMSTGSVGKVAAVAELFKVGASGKSESSKSTSHTDGSLDACRKSDEAADAPPKECGAPLRVELWPIANAPAKAQAEASKEKPEKPDDEKDSSEDAKKEEEKKVEENPCRPGYVLADGICSKAADAKSFLCDPNDAEVCKAQCEKGSGGSCFNYGAHLYKTGKPDDAAPFYKKGCDADHADSCARVAMTAGYRKNGSAGTKERLTLGKKACDLGSGSGCQWAGIAARSKDNPDGADREAAFQFFQRGCGLGYRLSCRMVARSYVKGDGVERSFAKGAAFYEKGCLGGDVKSCAEYALDLREKEPAKALKVASSTCDAYAEGMACEQVAEMLMAQNEHDKAYPYAKKACDVSDSWCRPLIKMYQTGKGTKKDPAAAQAIIKKICDDEVSRMIDDAMSEPVCKKGAATKAKPKPKPKK